MTNTYECPICQNIVHVSKLHCSTCGTIPARYSWTGKPRTINSPESHKSNATEIVVAIGAVRAAQHHLRRVNLRTVEHDYYAEV